MPGLLPQLDAAIDTLVAQKPQIFNLNDAQPGGAYRIKDVDAFYAGVIANLQAAGLCSQPSYGRDSLWIKENNSYSENYNVVTPRDYMERGPRSYNVTCTPANFPLTPEEAVRLVNVSFFRITNCPAGVTPLPPAFNQLPVGCVGTITATPKDAVGNKLPLDLHGADVKWFFEAGEGDIVAASPDQATPFNVRLYARTAGNFRICATVQTRTGCLNGTVTP